MHTENLCSLGTRIFLLLILLTAGGLKAAGDSADRAKESEESPVLASKAWLHYGMGLTYATFRFPGGGAIANTTVGDRVAQIVTVQLGFPIGDRFFTGLQSGLIAEHRNASESLGNYSRDSMDFIGLAAVFGMHFLRGKYYTSLALGGISMEMESPTPGFNARGGGWHGRFQFGRKWTVDENATVSISYAFDYARSSIHPEKHYSVVTQAHGLVFGGSYYLK